MMNKSSNMLFSMILITSVMFSISFNSVWLFLYISIY